MRDEGKDAMIDLSSRGERGQEGVCYGYSIIGDSYIPKNQRSALVDSYCITERQLGIDISVSSGNQE